jgi:hypothetical protein
MRVPFASLVIAGVVIAAAATGAAAQVPPPTQMQLDDLRARQEAAERQAVARSNELMALEARLRADQAVADLQAQRAPPPAPALRYEPQASTGRASVGKYPSVPDAALADSNRRVQAAAGDRR